MTRIIFLILCSLSIYAHAVIPEKVILCGVCRDVATRLPYTIKIMEQIGDLFENYRIIVYENNSVDQTPAILSKWAHENPKVIVQSEHCDHSFLSSVVINIKEDHQFYRPEEIARARNIVLDRAMSQEYQEFQYIIWMDMDFKIPPAMKGIIEVFESDREWDAVLAYGIDPGRFYWDWYAFRDAVYPIGSELLGNSWWYMKKNFELSHTSDWHPVYSAFGGCGIYKKSSIVDCRYSAVVTEDLEKVAKELIAQGKMSNHPQILNYLDQINQLQHLVTIPTAVPYLPKITDPNVGIVLHPEFLNPLVWKMSSFVYQYPSVCEHVPFHASMIVRGHGKIFINPRMIFNYGG